MHYIFFFYLQIQISITSSDANCTKFIFFKDSIRLITKVFHLWNNSLFVRSFTSYNPSELITK